ncbi:carph-isopro domain-containing protein [Novosphingobium sp.]|uniref:carph-isopro domain-containing protein n=1 Tax=Novosphingobium sp. TaxID=1874826 RepID=UPI003D0FEF4A
MHIVKSPQLSVFEKFGGIRPMAMILGIAPSTVKAWHYSRSIPAWRHDLIMRRAIDTDIALSTDELTRIRDDSRPLKRGRPSEPTSVAA